MTTNEPVGNAGACGVPEVDWGAFKKAYEEERAAYHAYVAQKTGTVKKGVNISPQEVDRARGEWLDKLEVYHEVRYEYADLMSLTPTDVTYQFYRETGTPVKMK